MTRIRYSDRFGIYKAHGIKTHYMNKLKLVDFEMVQYQQKIIQINPFIRILNLWINWYLSIKSRSPESSTCMWMKWAAIRNNVFPYWRAFWIKNYIEQFSSKRRLLSWWWKCSCVFVTMFPAVKTLHELQIKKVN